MSIYLHHNTYYVIYESLCCLWMHLDEETKALILEKHQAGLREGVLNCYLYDLYEKP